MTDRRCGTCKYFAFGQISVCTWIPEIDMPSWFDGWHAMWVDDGKNCKTWEKEPAAKQKDKSK